MDAFFASVEQADHPSWRGQPVIVGSDPTKRGVVSTCSYEARKFGVHSAMPSRTAYALCPKGIFVRPNMARYEDVSRQIFDIFLNITPFVERVSIDEAFLDISGVIHLHGSARAVGEKLRDEVRKKFSITCSVGIGPNRLLAKLGSEEGKPNGLVEMPFEKDAILSFLAPRPVGVLWGIGEQTEARLKHFGIVTCADLQRAPLARLERILASRHAAESAHRLAMGESDERVFYEEERAQSVSREFTFPEDETDRGKIRQKLLELVVDVGRVFRRERRWARTARLKLRDEAFQTRTRQAAFDSPARDDISFREKALELFEKEPIGALRLIGFGVANFQDDADERGPSLFASPDDEKRRKRERLSDALDALHDRGLV